LRRRASSLNEAHNLRLTGAVRGAQGARRRHSVRSIVPEILLTIRMNLISTRKPIEATTRESSIVEPKTSRPSKAFTKIGAFASL
jgi:hypothetical protein